MQTLIHLAVLTLTILVLARALPDVQIKSAGTALVVAIVFSLLNFFLAWFIKALFIVPGILTLGLLFLFLPFIVNAVLLWLTDKALSTFSINSLGSLFMSAGAITCANALLDFALRSYAAGHVMVSPGPTRWI
jgi:putative membrane protein